MSASSDRRVDSYIAKAAPFAQPILRHLRELVHQGAPAAEETIKWSFPHFLLGGRILCSMAAFKAHCTFGFWRREMSKLMATEGRRVEEAMGSLGRITRLEDLPDDRSLLGFIRKAAELTTSGEAARPTRRPRTPLRVPADLATALKENQAAAGTFAKFSPSHQREYIEWITEAKRDETRQKRLATTLVWLAEGKPRNWKYQGC